MNKKIFSVILIFWIFSVWGIDVEQQQLPVPSAEAWLTGPLLAPSAGVVSMGSVNVEPYLYLIGTTGQYDQNWTVQETPFFWTYGINPIVQFGIAPRVDFSFAPIAYYHETESQHAWALGDTQLSLGFLLLQESTYCPSIKLSLREIFPTGKYRNLDPMKLETDSGGLGSYVSIIGLNIGKLMQIRNFNFLEVRFAFGYSIPSSVFLKGFNTYGGDFGTKGTYYPSRYFTANLGLQYSLTQNWALALDVLCLYGTKSHFKGIFGSGLTTGNPEFADATVNSLTNGVSTQISLAPAIEYNWSKAWGVIAGCWFTAAGKNSSVFQSGVIALNYYK